MSEANSLSVGQRSMTSRWHVGLGVAESVIQHPVRHVPDSVKHKGTYRPHKTGTSRPMREVRDRLKWLRGLGEFRSMRAAANAYGVGYESYKKIGTGPDRGLTAEQAE